MKYMGSKNKLAKDIVPIIQKYIDDNKITCYIEPFVGGANIIDKITCFYKIGYDIHNELIALLKVLQTDKILPSGISKEEYEHVNKHRDLYQDWYVGLVGFCASYNAKYFGGYAGETQTKEGIRYYDRESIRNIEKQRQNIKNIKFEVCNFRDIDISKLNNCLLYCDIPYRNTTKYKTEDFPYEEFYTWCKEVSKNNTILISEYNMPNEFKCIWEKEHITTLDKNNNKKQRIEKLFTI